MAGSNEIDEVVRSGLSKYAKRAHVLRQIHSNKGGRAQRAGKKFLIVSVVVATAVSVIGFMGAERLAASISRMREVSTGTIEDLYNLSVLAILVVTLLGLIYRFDERSNRHYRSIEILTEFIRDVEDRVSLSAAGAQYLETDDLTAVRERYKGILATLPPSTDREYVKAKKSAAEKDAVAGKTGTTGLDGVLNAGRVVLEWDGTGGSAIESKNGEIVAAALSDPAHLAILVAVRDALTVEAWVTGGFVREAVWDHLHGFTVPTPVEDLDIVYFDPKRATEADEQRLEERLKRANPNVKWSVKNQVRMSVVNGDRPYTSLKDAVQRFPETATAVACRLDSEGRLKILAPWGLDDLCGLIVRMTPNADPSRFAERVNGKTWKARWPKLDVV